MALNDLFKKIMPSKGLVQTAAAELGNRAYKLHVEEAKASGTAPLPFADWQKQQAGN